ncbi:MAG: tail fiber domain-containing protein [Ferruginibacter sp.]
MKKLILLSLLLCWCIFLTAQNVGIGTNSPAASALLDISANNKGILIPRVALTGITDNITISFPVNTLLIYNTATAGSGPFVITPGFYFWNATTLRWTAIISSDNSSQSSWSVTGNASTSPTSNFLGTLDDQPLMFRQNNLWMGSLNSQTQNYYIGAGAGASTTSGAGNTGVGDSVMSMLQDAGYNTGVGLGAMQRLTTGTGNVAMGLYAMHLSDSSNFNIALGPYSLANNPPNASANIAIGVNALNFNTRNGLVAIGYYAGTYNGYLQSDLKLGVENTYIGNYSGLYANTGSKNVAIGSNALMGPGYYGDAPNNVSYKRNVAIGDSAMAAGYGSDNIAIGYKTLAKNNNSNQNVAVGGRALSSYTGFYPNTAIGYSSQDSAAIGGANTSLGNYSLTKNKQGSNNVAIGNYAMNNAENILNPSAMYDNTAVGNYALVSTHFSGQTAVGAYSLSNDTGGIYNTALGYFSLGSHQRGSSNTAIGTSALKSDLASSLNTAVGVNALYFHSSGDNNVAMGYSALFNDIDGGANTAIGSSSMTNHKTGGLNTAVGFESMLGDISGGLNTAIGFRALHNAKNGHENTAIGTGTIESSDSSFYNTALGNGAMNGKGGKFNTAVGYYASGLGTGGTTTNYYVNETTTIGYNAGFKNIADQNTFVGSYAGYGGASDSLRGIENTGIGSYTLNFNTSGRSNTALGIGALYANQTGSSNTALGTRALLFNVSGNRNVALGDSAFYGSSFGSLNTGVGFMVGVASNNLNNISAIGANAFVAQNNSMVLGSINGVNGATADTKVGIGTTAPDSTLSIANKFSVGNSGTIQYDNNVPVMAYMFKSGTTNPNRMIIAHSPAVSNWGLQYQDVLDRFNFLSAGIPVLTVELGTQHVGIGVISPTHQLQLSTDDAAKLSTSTWSITSDIRLKTVDGNYTKGLNEILKLNTIMYHYTPGNIKNLSSEEQGYGFSAQEVQKVFPEAVKTDKDGYLSLNIHPLLIAYVNAFKEQQQEIESMKSKNDLLTKDNDALKKDISLIKIKLGIVD